MRSGFIATPSLPTSGEAPKPEGILENDGFFPDLDPGQIRAVMRLDGTVTAARLREALKSAVLETNDALAEWKADRMQEGHARLADVPAPRLGGESRFEILYRKAVAASTTALLVERYRGYEASEESRRKDEDRRPNIDELRRDRHHALADFLGRPRCTVDLI